LKSIPGCLSGARSEKEDFKKIAATQNNLTEVLLKELRDTYEVPCLWITCKPLGSARNA
jgi:hypothetical protein